MRHTMPVRFRSHRGLAALLACLAACGSDDPEPDATAAVVRQYAAILDAMYEDSIAGVEELSARVDDLVTDPSVDALDAARQAWLDARPPFGEAEVSRFYKGPFDSAQGAMNEWPIDENYIDYTPGNPDTGIINDPEQFPDITPALLMSLVGRGGTENYATGFHAIEFLLWGSRPDQLEGPGDRPYTDFVDGGTAENQDRRRIYLKTVTLMLLEALRSVKKEWDLTDDKSYGADFVAADPHDSLTLIYRGFSQMAISEILYERLSNPFRSRDRKDEQSCFSETTWEDLNYNMLGVEHVYLGDYGKSKGPGITDLVAALDADQDERMRERITLTRKAIKAIPPPLDHAILSDPSSEPYLKVKEAVEVFEPMLDLLREQAETLDITNNL